MIWTWLRFPKFRIVCSQAGSREQFASYCFGQQFRNSRLKFLLSLQMYLTMANRISLSNRVFLLDSTNVPCHSLEPCAVVPCDHKAFYSCCGTSC